VRDARLPMATPHNLLVSPHALQIIERVRGGEIGELNLVEVECGRWDIINAGIHWANFFVVLTGMEPIASVQATCDASTRTWRDGMQVETEAVLLALTAGGRRFVLHIGDEIRTMREGRSTLFRIVGTEGLIEFWAWHSAYRLANRDHPGGELIEVPTDGRTGHQRHLESLADQMDAGAPDYAVPLSSLMALEICEAAYLSSRHRCTVRLPLESFEPPESTDWDPGRPYSGTGGGRDGRKL
jgi:predicted dehydrogenase